MDNAAAFRAMFSNVRFLKTADEVKFEFVVPRHEAQAAIDILGLPNPANPVWCGIAKLDPSAVE